jgi:transcriptional regulator with XRE-family HTH domain
MHTRRKQHRCLSPERLRELRTQRGWTLAELAERTGWNGQKVWRHEQGQELSYPSEVDTLARAFGLTREELLVGRSS